jgi:hypothetical protein
MPVIISHHKPHRNNFFGLRGLLRYATLHKHSRLWIPALVTILARRGVSDG